MMKWAREWFLLMQNHQWVRNTEMYSFLCYIKSVIKCILLNIYIQLISYPSKSKRTNLMLFYRDVKNTRDFSHERFNILYCCKTESRCCMSKKMWWPLSDNPKTRQITIRLDEEGSKLLEKCCKITQVSR